MLNAFELMKAMIEAGAAGVHFEDQLSSAKKCGHMGGKVLVPTQEAINKLVAARLAADVCGVPTVLVARTDAESATLLTADVDERDHAVHRLEGAHERGLLPRQGRHPAGDRARPRLCAVCGPDLVRDRHAGPARGARNLPKASTSSFPGKLLAYNCSPSFNWKKKLDDATIAKFQRELGAMGYKFQFITLAGFHALNFSMFELARGYKESQMSAYVAVAAGGVRGRDRRLHGDQAPARSRRGLLRRRDADGDRAASPRSRRCSGSTEEAQFKARLKRGKSPRPGAAFDPDCRRCPRLARFLDSVASRAHPDYHCRPVAAFGEPRHRLLIVGLAPGLTAQTHRAAVHRRPCRLLLYRTLHGSASRSRAESVSADDGLSSSTAASRTP